MNKDVLTVEYMENRAAHEADGVYTRRLHTAEKKGKKAWLICERIGSAMYLWNLERGRKSTALTRAQATELLTVEQSRYE